MKHQFQKMSQRSTPKLKTNEHNLRTKEISESEQKTAEAKSSLSTFPKVMPS